MKFKCVDCNNSGNLGTFNNLKNDTNFLTKQWFKDKNGLIHTLVICLKCGTFHDCKFSILSFFIGKPYKAVGILTKNDIIQQVEIELSKDETQSIQNIALKTMAINDTILKYLVKQGLFPNKFITTS